MNGRARDHASSADGARLVALLQHHAAIPTQEVQTMLQRVRRGAAPKGSVLQAQGAAADWLGVLDRGLVRSHVLLDGKDVNFGFEFEGGFIGAYEAYMARTPANYAVEALEDVVYWRFDRDVLDGLLDGHPCWRLLAGRVAEVELVRRLERDVERRTRTVEQRYAALLHAESPLVRRLPLYHLASWLGVTAETLSRIRARMG